MAVIKELREVVELVAQYGEEYQKRAVKDLLHIVERAEQDIADSHLSEKELQEARYQRHMAYFERRYGKVEAIKLRAKLDAIRNGDF